MTQELVYKSKTFRGLIKLNETKQVTINGVLLSELALDEGKFPKEFEGSLTIQLRYRFKCPKCGSENVYVSWSDEYLPDGCPARDYTAFCEEEGCDWNLDNDPNAADWIMENIDKIPTGWGLGWGYTERVDVDK